MKPMVSVVVPVYKVEKYIDRCVKSIINQTYTNLEIILVDDGSPDKCGSLIDQYSQIDSRIISVHKENGGLSDARNYGMNYVTGQYTLFVDSDDWLELQMIEIMVDNSIKFRADVVQSAFFYAYEDHLLFENRYFSKDEPPTLLDKQELMKELVINERVKNFAWGKLYKTELIKDIPFKKGVLFEDVFWAHQVMHLVNTFVMLHKPMCYYFQRSDSIVSTYTPRNLDIIKGLIERHAFLETHYKHLTSASYKNILKANLIHFNLLLINSKKDRGGVHKKDIQRYIKENNVVLMKSVEEDNYIKQQLKLFLIHPYLNILPGVTYKILRKIRLVPQPLKLERINL